MSDAVKSDLRIARRRLAIDSIGIWVLAIVIGTIFGFTAREGGLSLRPQPSARFSLRGRRSSQRLGFSPLQHHGAPSSFLSGSSTHGTSSTPRRLHRMRPRSHDASVPVSPSCSRMKRSHSRAPTLRDLAESTYSVPGTQASAFLFRGTLQPSPAGSRARHSQSREPLGST